MNPGLLYAVTAFAMWGLFPLYFRLLAAVPAFEVVLHRSTWSLVFLLGVLAVTGRLGALGRAVRQVRTLGPFVLSAGLLACNWFLYVFAVHHERVVEASLGYYINPLVNVVLGVVVLRERLRPLQWVAVALAAAGVGWLTLRTGQLPWIALLLAISFGFYGLMRKTSNLGPLEGLSVETALLAPVVLPWLVWWTLAGHGALARADGALTTWLLVSGPLTALPLLLFAAGARRLTLTTVGQLQYLSPTIQLLLGVWAFGEPFDSARLAGFVLIWLGLGLYSTDALATGKRSTGRV